jgi:glutamate mutase epsilon subunit
MIGGNKIEIKPTKLKYFRNKAASAYGVIKAVPIHELLTYEKGVLDEKRDADQLLYDFLVATFDDPVLVRDNYNEMDADVLEKIIKIFGRLNHIDDKQEALRKNKEAQAKP